MSSRNIEAVLALAIAGALAGTGCAAQSDDPVVGSDEAAAVEALAPSGTQAQPTELTGEAQQHWWGGFGRGGLGWGGLGWGGWGGLGWGGLGWGGLGWGGLGWGGGWGGWGGWGGCGGCGGWGGGWW